MPTLWLFDIEPHEQRYTIEWQEHLPKQLMSAMQRRKKPWKLEVVHGSATSGRTTPGAFLNFAETNAYKACQIAEFSLLVQQGRVKDGDRALFADAWHPGVIHLKYMADLLPLELSIDVMWHAGSYDPYDFLGRTPKVKKWSYNFERAVFEAADRNYFATKFHRKLFTKKINPSQRSTYRVVGWPMEYLGPLLKPLAGSVKKDTILFPHRIAPEKMPEAFELLSEKLSQYRIVIAQKTPLSKAQYHQELARALVVFSANKQETLGIGTYEGILTGAAPIVPKRLSYTEIYRDWCYPSKWSESPSAVRRNAMNLVRYIQKAVHEPTPKELKELGKLVGRQYFNGSKLYASVLR